MEGITKARTMKLKNEALQNLIDKNDYYAHRKKILWQSKKCSWNWLMVSWGIRRSNKAQRFPIWNHSNNNHRSIIFGFNFYFFQVLYHRAKPFNQKRKRLFSNKRWIYKLYQLID